MLCPKCGTLLKVKRSFMTFENDDTPDKETFAYMNHEMMCTNDAYVGEKGQEKRCPLYNTVVKTMKNKMN